MAKKNHHRRVMDRQNILMGRVMVDGKAMTAAEARNHRRGIWPGETMAELNECARRHLERIEAHQGRSS